MSFFILTIACLGVCAVFVKLLARVYKRLGILDRRAYQISEEIFKVKMGLNDIERRIIEINKKVEPLEWKLLSDEDRDHYETYSDQQLRLDAIVSTYKEAFRELEDELRKDEPKSLAEREEKLWEIEKRERRREEGPLGREAVMDGDIAVLETRHKILEASSNKEFIDYLRKEFHEMIWLEDIDEKRIKKAMFDISWMFQNWMTLKAEKESGKR